MLFHLLQVFADFAHNGIRNHLLRFLIVEYFCSISKTDIDCRSYIKGKSIDKIIIGRTICCPLNLRDNVIYFLLRYLFRNLFHLPAMFRPVAAVSIVFVIPPYPFSICISAICSGWAPIVSIIHFSFLLLVAGVGFWDSLKSVV